MSQHCFRAARRHAARQRQESIIIELRLRLGAAEHRATQLLKEVQLLETNLSEWHAWYYHPSRAEWSGYEAKGCVQVWDDAFYWTLGENDIETASSFNVAPISGATECENFETGAMSMEMSSHGIELEEETDVEIGDAYGAPAQLFDWEALELHELSVELSKADESFLARLANLHHEVERYTLAVHQSQAVVTQANILGADIDSSRGDLSSTLLIISDNIHDSIKVVEDAIDEICNHLASKDVFAPCRGTMQLITEYRNKWTRLCEDKRVAMHKINDSAAVM